MRIDAHQHFWHYRHETHPWISASMHQLQRDFLPADLEPLLAAAGFDGCVAVQAQQRVAETEWLLELADAHPFIRGVVGWVDLCAPDVSDELARLAGRARLRGVRHIVQDEADDRFIVRPQFTRGIAALAQFDLTYDILVYARQLPAAVELARQFPQQRFVLDHIGKPEIRDRSFEPWRRDLGRLAACPNASCKLSGLVTEGDWHAWQPADFVPYLDIVLDCFGAQRLMIGSDWPVCTLAGSYGDVVAIVADYIAHLSESERQAIMGDNVVRFYRLA